MTLNPLWDLKGFFSLSLSFFQRDTDLLNIHPWIPTRSPALSLFSCFAKRTLLPRPPLPPPYTNAHQCASAAHLALRRLMEICTGASDAAGYVLQFSMMEGTVAALLLYHCSSSAPALTLWGLSSEAVCASCSREVSTGWRCRFFRPHFGCLPLTVSLPSSSKWLSSGAAGDIALHSGRPTAKVWRAAGNRLCSVSHRALDLQSHTATTNGYPRRLCASWDWFDLDFTPPPPTPWISPNLNHEDR